MHVIQFYIVIIHKVLQDILGISCVRCVCETLFPRRQQSPNRNERHCQLCNSNKIGDEYHYILECQTCMHERKRLLGDYYCNRVNTVKFKMLFQSKNCPLLKNICKFIKYINTNVSSIDQIWYFYLVRTSWHDIFIWFVYMLFFSIPYGLWEINKLWNFERAIFFSI